MEGCQVEKLLFLEMVWTYCLCEKVFPRYKLVLRDLLSLICRLFEDDTISGLLAMRFPTPLGFLKYSGIPLSPRIKPSTGLFIDRTDNGALVCVFHIVCVRMREWVWDDMRCFVGVSLSVWEWERGGEGGGRLFHLYEWIIKALITSMAEDVVKLKCLQVSDTFLWLCLVW